MAQDPLGLVYNKTEGSGAAQIFGPSEAVKNLRDFGQQKFAADDAARKKALDAVKPKPQKLTEFGQPWRIDQKYISDALGLFTKGATQKINAGIDLSTDKEYLDSVNLIKTAIEGSTQQQKLYDDLTKSVINAPDKFDVDATLAQLKEWEQIPLMQRLSTPMPDPIYKPKEEEPVDLFKPFDAVKIGMIKNTSWNEDRESGLTTDKPNEAGLMAQIDAIIKANPKLYKEGLLPQEDTGQPLWNSKEEQRQYYFDYKLGQGDYTTQELIRNEAEGDAFGSGYGEEDVLFDTDEWRAAFLSGEENAAGYLTGPAEAGVKTNDGYVLDGVSKVGSFDLTDPKQLDKASKYIVRVLADGRFTLGSVGGTGVDAVAFATKYSTASPEQKKEMLKSIFKQDGDVVSVYRYSGVGNDLTVEVDGGKIKQPVNKEVIIIPQMLTDEELEAYYLKALKNKKKLYNKDFAVNAAGNVRNTGAGTQPSKKKTIPGF